MVNVRGRTQSFDSPKREVGEIDTRAPFQSVKAAVSLFGEVAITRRPSMKKSRMSAENILDKETQFILAQREIDKHKQALEAAETARNKAAVDLEKAKITMKDLTSKLTAMTKSKQAAMEVVEDLKNKTKVLEVAKSQKQLGNGGQKQELQDARQLYRTTADELDAAKQELTRIRQDFDAALEAKSAAFQRAAEAQRAANVSSDKASELSKQVKDMKESHQQLKVAMEQAQQCEAKSVEDKIEQIKALKNMKEEAKAKFESLNKDYDPQVTRDLEVKLVETTVEIEVLQEEMKRAHASEMEKVKLLTCELDEATRALQAVAREESELRNLLDTLREELENVKWEQAQLLTAIAEKERQELEEHNRKLDKLSSEAESARREALEMKKSADEFKQEAENARLMAEEVEKNLQLAIRETEEAKAAERRATEEMKAHSDQEKKTESQTNCKIKISFEEFNNLKKKTAECITMADYKSAEALSEVEAMNSRKAEAEKKIEANLKSIEEIKEATDMALQSAEMAEAAQSIVEGELRKWRDQQEIATA